MALFVPVAGRVLEAVFFVRGSRRARRILEVLARSGRLPTVPLLDLAVGRVGRDDHLLLKQMAAMGLIRRYKGENDGHWVVWNELTPLGRRVLEIVESMEG